MSMPTLTEEPGSSDEGEDTFDAEPLPSRLPNVTSSSNSNNSSSTNADPAAASIMGLHSMRSSVGTKKRATMSFLSDAGMAKAIREVRITADTDRREADHRRARGWGRGRRGDGSAVSPSHAGSSGGGGGGAGGGAAGGTASAGAGAGAGAGVGASDGKAGDTLAGSDGSGAGMDGGRSPAHASGKRRGGEGGAGGGGGGGAAGSGDASRDRVLTGAQSLPGLSKKAYKRAEEFKLQQLRGIFSAFDEGRSGRRGVLTKEDLGNALLALGVNPTQRAIQRYHMSSTASSGSLDLPTFLRVSMHKLDGLDRTKEMIIDLFRVFDTEGKGTVPVSVVRHILTEVHSTTELDNEETEELLMFAGVIDGSKESDKGNTGRAGRRKRGAKARAGHKTLDYNAEVDYHHLVDVMML